MYIDFKDPEKNSYNNINKNQSKPKKETSFSALRNKYSKKESNKKPEKVKKTKNKIVLKKIIMILLLLLINQI